MSLHRNYQRYVPAFCYLRQYFYNTSFHIDLMSCFSCAKTLSILTIICLHFLYDVFSNWEVSLLNVCNPKMCDGYVFYMYNNKISFCAKIGFVKLTDEEIRIFNYVYKSARGNVYLGVCVCLLNDFKRY